jgi:hypothetical protein
VEQRAVGQTTPDKLAVPSLFNYVPCKGFPHEIGLLMRKFSPASFHIAVIVGKLVKKV